MKRSGLTLIEMVITLSLLSVLFAGLFNVSGARKTTLEVVKANTIAIYALESLKNKTQLEIDQREFLADKFASKSSEVIDSPNWNVDSEILTTPDGRKNLSLRLKDLRSLQNRVYSCEVKLSHE